MQRAFLRVASCTHPDSAAEMAPGVGELFGTVKAGGPAGPAGLAPVHARPALLPEDAHHPLRMSKLTFRIGTRKYSSDLNDLT